MYIVGTRGEAVSLDGFEKKTARLGEILEKGLPTVDTRLTRLLLNHYRPSQLYGKIVKDKRGGIGNIHSWDIGLKGDASSGFKFNHGNLGICL